MKIYIASSWKNQHGVKMLTDLLRVGGLEVISWIENNFEENPDAAGNDFNFEKWMKSDSANRSFEFDTQGAATCDLFIYYGPAGKDAAAECGICYGQRLAGKTIPMLALWSKSEDFGLMRKMFDQWFNSVEELINKVVDIHQSKFPLKSKKTLFDEPCKNFKCIWNESEICKNHEVEETCDFKA